MTRSIAEPRPHPSARPGLSIQPDRSARPVLRRLADILPPPEPAAPEPPAPTPRMGDSVIDPSASAQAERMLRAMVEILGGRRPAHQLSVMLRPDLLSYLTDLRAVAGSLQPRVCKVFTQRQETGVVEAVALVSLSTGIRALAARFEQQSNSGSIRWCCTALQLRFTTGDVAMRHRRR